jgi:large subunit ribosomal protein L33
MRRASMETALRSWFNLNGEGICYSTNKNKRTTPDRLEFRKYGPRVRKHALSRESR